jgi:hypothetical protein
MSSSSSENVKDSKGEAGGSDVSIEESVTEKLSSDFQLSLQRSEGHFCTICDEKHFLQERDLATLDNACGHVFCYDGLSERKGKNPKTLQCPTCNCAATNIYCHKYTPSTSTSNRRISQEFLQQIQGHYCSICHEQHYLTSADPATFETEAQCTHIYCYNCLLSRMRTS